ncbi:amidohydrolase family protein [Limimaricola pyoseonensis]|uniref:Predicted metal-dependent hydrolase, TIM-barrel fold n=1 Tax=Limimaricola pyoseonensis TaxID=521013 RepID=A0A1G7G6H6_9RHOB|nr:amidohydrolase family protein [Limimaricola pyoseonensis]SDE83629.1 Predicted metal-dependent hydrolase, TIM-barrel fold [Limimaricola pyoseonensis]
MIDAHVHFYTARDLARVAGGLPYALPQPHPLTGYLDRLIDAGRKPRLINNVHLSILPDSENVFAGFDELAALQARDPARYGGIAGIGTILADPAYATAARLAHPQVKGIRMVLHDRAPESVGAGAYSGAAWRELYARLRPDQHLHVYAQDPATTLEVMAQLPEEVPLVIDHLGTCRPERGTDDPAFLKLLATAKARGNTWFKGPGYRTSTDAAVVAAFAGRIIDTLGPGRLVLGASDAPHVGADHDGRPFAESYTPLGALDFAADVAARVARATGIAAETLLSGAAAEMFDPSATRAYQ